MGRVNLCNSMPRENRMKTRGESSSVPRLNYVQSERLVTLARRLYALCMPETGDVTAEVSRFAWSSVCGDGCCIVIRKSAAHPDGADCS